jgi:hypothetical protein
MGVCLLGNFEIESPSALAIDSLTRLLAWKVAQRSIDPQGTAYHANSQLIINTISGHLDGTGSPNPDACAGVTECPGANLYAKLPQIRSTVKSLISPLGSIRVTIQPQAAVEAGAQWKMANEEFWRNSGAFKPGLALGSHDIEFKTVPGWIAPSKKNIELTAISPDVNISDLRYTRAWLGIEHTSLGMRLTLHGENNKTFTIESSTNMEQWAELSSQFVDSGAFTAELLTNDVTERRFYRFRQE